MKIKTRGLFRRLAEADKRVKTLLLVLALGVLGGGVYGIVRATTADGAMVTVTTEGKYMYGYTDMTETPGQYHTNLFTVSSGNGNYGAMCLEPRKLTTTGSASTAKLSNTSSFGKLMIRVMLVTDYRHNGNIYAEFNSAYPNIWYNFSSAVIQYGPDPSVAPYVMGHVILGRYADAEYPNYFAMESYAAQIDSAVNTINAWFDSNYPNEHKSWSVYRASSTASDAWNRQDVGWIEPEMAQIRVHKVDQDGNNMSGATFDVTSTPDIALYGDPVPGLSNISTDSNGYSAYLSVPVGQYYCFSENQGIDGYEPRQFEFCTENIATAGSKQTVTFVNERIVDVKGSIQIKKVDSETNSTTPQGGASIQGAKFGFWRDTCGTSTSDSNFVKSLTLASSGTVSLKNIDLGTYCVAELSPGRGYMIPTPRQTRTVTLTEANPSVSLVSDPFTNNIIKGGVKVTKMKKIGSTTSAFAGVKFKITSNSSSSFTPITIPSNSNGVAQTAVNVLPYGSYTITEVCDSTNAAYDCGYTETFNITENNTRVTLKGNTAANDGTVLNTSKSPSISTKASVCDSSSTSVPISASACVQDVITLKSNFTTGTKYKITATLKSGSTTVKTKDITWTQASGTTSQTIRFDTFDSSDYVDKTLYVVATLAMESGGSWYDLATFNADGSDANEQVKVGGYSMDTAAVGADGSVDGNGNLYIGNVTLRDTVGMSGLKNGTTYKIQGYVVKGTDCSGTKVTLTNGDSGNATLKTDDYRMSGTTGGTVSTSMEFKFNSAPYVGQTLTVCEKVLSSSGATLMTHNGGSTQQVKVATPTVATSAKNKEDGTRTVQIGDVTIIDTVTYAGLMPGNTYTLKAALYNVNNTSSSIATATSSFTASTASGTTTESESPQFAISTGSLAGQTIVVYEELYLGNTKIAEHKNVNDSAQRIRVSEVDIQTIAMSAVDSNTKSFNVGGNVTVRDTVKLKGLVNGTNYKVRGWLVDQNGTIVDIVDGAGVSGDKVTIDYRMTAATGTQVSASMDFTFDSVAYAGKKLTVYEELLDANSNVLATHAVLGEAAQTITITRPEIGTSVNPKELYVGDQTLVDTVDYNNLVAGQTYTLITKLMKVNRDGTVTPVKNGNTAIEQSGPVQVPSGRTSGQFRVALTFNTIEYQGADLVVYEYLQYNGVDIAKHEDATVGPNNSQWTKVKTATIGTKAKDGNDTDNIIEPEKNQKVSDTVSYSGLQPGQTYTMSGTIMRKDNGEALKINGQKITASKKFTASSNGAGTVEMSFTLDATDLPGVSMVVFEELYIGAEISGEPLLEHEDLSDTEQLVLVRPRIGTAASDKLDGDQEVGVGDVTVYDTVKYEGLTVGKKYIAVGTLVDKETGEVLEVVTRCKKEDETSDESDIDGPDGSGGSTIDDSSSDPEADETVEDCIVPERKIRSQVEFTVTGEGTAVITDGTIEPLLEFYLSTRDLVGKKVVVFEEVYEADGYVEDESEPVAVHKDLEDEAQIIIVSDPKIGTMAVDKIDGDKELNNNGTVVIEDTVEYKGLVPGTSYILKGSLRDKETGEALTLLDSTIDANQVNGEKAKLSGDNKELSLVVTADRTDGKFYMNFEINTDGMAGKQLVVFESLYIETITEGAEDEEYIYGEKELVEHRDLNDEAQTVNVKVNPPDTGLIQKDGGAAKSVKVVLIVTTVTFVAALAGYFGMRTYKKRKMSL